MNKKLITLLTSSIIAASVSANANNLESFNPYIGLDYQYTVNDYESGGDKLFPNNFSGINVYAGIRPHNNFSFELGYYNLFEEGKSTSFLSIPITNDLRTYGLTFDALGYLPVGQSGKFQLIATAGIAYVNTKLTVSDATASESVEFDDVGYRIGAGVEYKLTDNVGARAIVRYQTISDVPDSTMVNIGVNYKF